MQKALLSSTPVDDNDVKEFTSAKPLRKASKSDIEDLLGVKVDSALFTNVNDNGKEIKLNGYITDILTDKTIDWLKTNPFSEEIGNE